MPDLRIRTIATLAALLGVGALFSGCASTPPATGAVGPPWTGETFLPNYNELKPVPTKGGGQDYIYLAPNMNEVLGQDRRGVVIDQPEVFISPESPYKGAKPADLESIAEFLRDHLSKALTAHGYKVTDQKGPGTVYIRLALSDLQLQTKSRSILAYTPVGFVISSAVRAVQDFLEKMDILNMALQAQFLDGGSGTEIAAAVISRGGNGAKMSYSDFDALINEYSERAVCRLDNARVPESQRIDCTDPQARTARPKVTGS